jgi:hypothetical protein
VADRAAELDSLALELRDGRVDVVAHQIELVPIRLVSGVSGEFRRRQGEDQPAAPRVDGWEPKRVSKQGTDRLRILREYDHVGAGNHGCSFLVLEWAVARRMTAWVQLAIISAIVRRLIPGPSGSS